MAKGRNSKKKKNTHKVNSYKKQKTYKEKEIMQKDSEEIKPKKEEPKLDSFGDISKILYKTNLKLETALHIGCAQNSPVGSFEMMKNGADEYIIPGTSIAGVFFDSLKALLEQEENHDEMSFLFAKCSLNNNSIYLVPKDKLKKINILSPRPKIEKLKVKNKECEYHIVLENLYHDDEGKIKDIYKEIFKSMKKYRNSFASPLIFRSVTLKDFKYKKIRNRTKINRETKTADDGALFSYWEIEPENVSFDINLEIDNLSIKNNKKDLETLKNWIKLVFTSWKKEGIFFGAHNTSGNGYCSLENVQESIVNSDNFENYLDNKLEYKEMILDSEITQPRFKKWIIKVDLNAENYGTNALLIKGGFTHKSLVKNTADSVFINTGERLFIPGSSLKGSFSMFLEKYGKGTWLEEFLGQNGSNSQGYIYFPDLHFSTAVNNKNRHLMQIERHAEDEFTRAVYGSGKFNEERLFHTSTKGTIRIPIKFYEEHKTSNDSENKLDEFINFIKQGCEKQLISLGANSCFPKITIIEED